MPNLLDALDGHARDLVHVDQALLFFLDQVFEGLVDLHLPLLGALAEDVGQHVLDVDVHLLDALVGDDFEGREIALAHVDFDHAVVELAFAQLLAQFLAGAALRLCPETSMFLRAPFRPVDGSRTGSGGGKQNIEQALFGVEFGLVGDVFELLFAHHVDGDFDQVANHGFDIASHVADFGKLRGFHFQERRVGELGQAARDFGFAHAGGADHDDVLGNDSLRPGPAASFWRRMRLRSAMATARLASFWPTTCLSSSATISRGVSSSRAICSSSAAAGK